MSDTPVEAFIHLAQDTIVGLSYEAHLAPMARDLELFAKQRLIPLWHRERASIQTPYVLALVGLTNVGKSTLLEALLGWPVAPRKAGPATAIPVEYIYDSTWSTRFQYVAAKRPTELAQFPDAQALGQHLVGRVVGVSAAKASEVAWVTVRGPMQMLVNELHLADTPGFGAAQAESDPGCQQRLEDFLSRVVHRVYFCVAAGAVWAVSDIEKQFYHKISAICGHVVITKWEDSPEEERKYRNRYQSLFPAAEFVFVNAKRAMRTPGQPSSLDILRETIASYSTLEKRRAMCDPEVLSAWRDLHENMKSVHRLPGIPWPLHSLRQFTQACCDRPGLDELSRELTHEIQKEAK